ncbi:MAG: regulatory protein RecX [Gemmatimonadales bacterium]
MRVTSLETEPRSGGVRVELDDAPFGTVSIADVTALGLSLERRLSEHEKAALAYRAEVFSARTVALTMLSSRALPSAEILRRLHGKGHPRPAAEEAAGALREAGMIDDAEFARHYARTRAVRQRFGTRRLLAELRRLGVNDKVAEAAVKQALEQDGVDESAVLREAAGKKARTLQGLDPETAKRRLRSYLLRRGFKGGDLSQVVREALGR